MEKIIAVLSFTGKVGKSTIVNNLLLPRMPNAAYIEMETINVSGQNDATETLKLKGREIGKMQDALRKTKSAVVDVGASNVEAFMLALKQQSGAHFDFDYFIVPIEANSSKHNEAEEAMKTIDALAGIGIEPDRIKVIFNKLLADSNVEEEAARIFNFHKSNKKFTLDARATIHDTPAFKALAEVKKTYIEMIGDKTNYRQQFRETPLEEDDHRLHLTKMMRAQGCVQAIHTEFNSVFSALFAEQV